MKKFLGIDIGGTNTKAVLIDENLEIISFGVGDTPASGGPQAEIAILSEMFDFLKIPVKDVDAVGIGIPGPVDNNGIVHNPPNLKHWGDVDIGKYFAEFFKYPRERIAVDNDVNFAAMSEYHIGNGKRANPMIMLTLGTGVGGSVLIDGLPLRGRDGFAGELGHIIIEPNGPRCGCGRKGCAEALISHHGIVKTAWKILRRDKGSIMWNMLEGDFRRMSPELIEKAANIGDPAANKILDITANYLGTLLADLINIFNPERIVIGGGISRWGDALLEPARKIAKRQALKNLAKSIKIVRAKFYQRAGAMGAAIYVKNNL